MWTKNVLRILELFTRIWTGGDKHRKESSPLKNLFLSLPLSLFLSLTHTHSIKITILAHSSKWKIVSKSKAIFVKMKLAAEEAKELHRMNPIDSGFRCWKIYAAHEVTMYASYCESMRYSQWGERNEERERGEIEREIETKMKHPGTAQYLTKIGNALKSIGFTVFVTPKWNKCKSVAMLHCIRCSVNDITFVGCLYLTMGQHNIQILQFIPIFLWLSGCSIKARHFRIRSTHFDSLFKGRRKWLPPVFQHIKLCRICCYAYSYYACFYPCVFCKCESLCE